MDPEDRNALETALDSAIKDAGKARSPEMALFFQVLHLRDEKETALSALRNLLNTITSIPKLEIFNVARHHNPYGSSEQVDYYYLIYWLVSRAQQSNGHQAVADLCRYLESDELEIAECLAFRGVKIENVCKILDFSIIPWKNLPNTDWKYQKSIESFWGMPVPDAIVQRKHKIQKMHLRPWMVDPDYKPHSIEPMLDVLRCGNCAAGIGYQLVAYWFEPPEWAPYKMSRSTFGVDDSRALHRAKLDDPAVKETADLVARLTALGEPKLTRYRLIADWLNRSICATHATPERAIAIGVALEALFAPKKLTEGLSRTIRSRAARFLGTSNLERKDIFERVKDVYELRSRAVHSGSLFDEKGKAALRTLDQHVAVLEFGQEIVQRALAKLIRSGEPDWDDMDIGNWP